MRIEENGPEEPVGRNVLVRDKDGEFGRRSGRRT
jgi:hypothetical protein